MDPDTLHSVMKKVVIVLTSIWGMYVLPSLILVIFAAEGALSFATENIAAHKVLYFNVQLFPFLLLTSIGLSWLLMKYKKYWLSIAAALLPIVSILIEIIAADIALILSYAIEDITC